MCVSSHFRCAGDEEDEMLAVDDIYDANLLSDDAVGEFCAAAARPKSVSQLHLSTTQKAMGSREGSRPVSASPRTAGALVPSASPAARAAAHTLHGPLPGTPPAFSKAPKPFRIMSAPPANAPSAGSHAAHLPPPAWPQRPSTATPAGASHYSAAAAMHQGAHQHNKGREHIIHSYLDTQVHSGAADPRELNQGAGAKLGNVPASAHPSSPWRSPNSPAPFSPRLRTRPPSSTRVGIPLSEQLTGRAEPVVSKLFQPTTSFLGKVATSTTAPLRPGSATTHKPLSPYVMPPGPLSATPHSHVPAQAAPQQQPTATPKRPQSAQPTLRSTSQAGQGAAAATPPTTADAADAWKASVAHKSDPWRRYKTPKPGPKRPLSAFAGHPLTPAAGKAKSARAGALPARELKEVVVQLLPQTDKQTGNLVAKPDSTPFVMPSTLMAKMLDSYRMLH